VDYEFADRRAAGRALAARLRGYAGCDDVVVLALPRRGVPVAYEVARALQAPLGLLTVSNLAQPIDFGPRQPVSLEGMTAIVVDDALASGASMSAALTALRREHPAWVVSAVPVAAPEAQDRIGTGADEFVCLLEPPGFSHPADYYRDFGPVSESEVQRLLAAAAGE
jgi:putative phosphoribosyl transferase